MCRSGLIIKRRGDSRVYAKIVEENSVFLPHHKLLINHKEIIVVREIATMLQKNIFCNLVGKLARILIEFL